MVLVMRRKNELARGSGKTNLDREMIFKTDPSPHILDLRKIAAERRREVKKIEPIKKAKEEKIKIEVIKKEKKKINLSIFKKILDFWIKAPQGVYYFTIGEIKQLWSRMKSLIISIFKFLIDFFCKVRAFFLLPKENIQKFEDNFKFLKLSLADCKKIISFGLVAFVFILPLQAFSYYGSLKRTENRVMDGASEAYSSLVASGGQIANSDFSGAANNLAEAAGAFSAAQRELNKINFIVAGLAKALPQGERMEAGDALFFAGEKLSLVGRNLLDSVADFTKNDSNIEITSKIKILRDKLSEMLPDISEAGDRLISIESEAIPEDKQDTFRKLQEKLPSLVLTFKKLISVSDLMIKFLGDGEPKRYLFIFQNTGERRATGGFMGSMALVDFDKGSIKNIEVPGGGPYDFTGSLKEKIIAPGPLTLINPRWEIQDANWFPDFKTSAEKIKWFYEKGGGPTIDGVVAINSDVIVDLLKIVGPIELLKYKKTVNADNFIDEIQKSVEIEYNRKENKPKQIIGDLTPVLLEKIFASNPRDFGKILSTFATSLREKDIILHSVFPEIEHELLNLDWGGGIKNVNQKTDYLMIVHSNLGGGKTDRVMEDNATLETTISYDGYIKNKLTIRRTHQGKKGEAFTGMRNVDYLRIYVPEGSTLINAEGFEAPPEELFEKASKGYVSDPDLKILEDQVFVDEATKTRIGKEAGKTVFGNWVQVDPEESVTVIVEYMLPFKFPYSGDGEGWLRDLQDKFSKDKENSFYQILIQKQSGTKINFTNKISFPERLKAEWYYGKNMEFGQTFAIANNNLETDLFFLLGFVKK
jgi:hypothetical protein